MKFKSSHKLGRTLLRLLFVVVTMSCVSACSRAFRFSPELKGISVWNKAEYIQTNLDKKEPECNNLSQFLCAYPRSFDWEPYQAKWAISSYDMGEFVDRVLKSKNGTALLKHEFSNIEWEQIDERTVEGKFDLNAYSGSGTFIFKALNLDKEWVIFHLSIPRKEGAMGNPHIIINFTENEVKKLLTEQLRDR